MPATSVSIRLGVEGKAEIKRAFEEVSKAGQDAFRGVATSIDVAGAAADRQTQRLQRLSEAAKQAAAADQAQKSFNQVLGVGVGVRIPRANLTSVRIGGKGRGRPGSPHGGAARADRPLGAAQTRLNAEIAEANSLFKQARSRRRSRPSRTGLRRRTSTPRQKRSARSGRAGSSLRASSST